VDGIKNFIFAEKKEKDRNKKIKIVAPPLPPPVGIYEGVLYYYNAPVIILLLLYAQRYYNIVYVYAFEDL
jgi:hypothetical protein